MQNDPGQPQYAIMFKNLFKMCKCTTKSILLDEHRHHFPLQTYIRSMIMPTIATDPAVFFARETKPMNKQTHNACGRVAGTTKAHTTNNSTTIEIMQP